MSIVAAVAPSVIGGLFGSSASGQAAQTQQQGVQQANALQQQMYSDTTNNLAPYRGIGVGAANTLAGLVGLAGKDSSGNSVYDSTANPWLQPFGLSQFQASPAYQFNLDQGRQALDKASAARGNYYAPQTLQDIAKYSQGVASNEFQNAFNNYNTNQNNVWGRLSGLAGSGQNAAVQQGGFNSSYGNQVGNNLIGASNSAAAGQVGTANAIGSAGQSGYNNYLLGQIIGNQQQGTYSGSNVGSYGNYNQPQMPTGDQYSLSNQQYG